MNAPQLAWPTALLGSPPNRREINTACGLVLAVVVVCLCVFAASAVRGGRIGYDFIGFYSPGRLLNEYPAEQLYDLAVQEQVFRGLQPGEPFLTLPYVHAPFEALLFAVLSRLPYSIAYFTWLGCSALGYTGALLLLLRRFGPRDPRWRRTALLLSWSFHPFVMESWLGGISTL